MNKPVLNIHQLTVESFPVSDANQETGPADVDTGCVSGCATGCATGCGFDGSICW
ncbi:MAG TPA: hypothetical protein VK358_06080 [Longimicrobium sp.]|nr:hypothetical protein [Longimicrobium sp.]